MGFPMRDYSVRYLDALGRTETSELLPFVDNKLATDFAHTRLVRYPIVEVWREDDLIVRLYRPAPEARPGGHIGDPASTATVLHVDRRARLEEWDNEGGRSRPSEGLPRL
jgi:hypothetical protein